MNKTLIPMMVLASTMILSCTRTKHEIIDEYCQCVSNAGTDSTSLADACDEIAKTNIADLKELNRKGVITEAEVKSAEVAMWQCHDHQITAGDRIKEEMWGHAEK